MAISIIGSVGYKARNDPNDVRKIHLLLKQIPISQGGPPATFDPNKPYSQQTDQMIYQFQLAHWPKGWGDAKVEPGRDTLAKLNKLADLACPPPTGIMEDANVARPYSPTSLSDIASEFADAFVAGLTGHIDPTLGKIISDKILADKTGFYLGYVSGVVIGLVAGLKALVELLITVAKLTERFSINGIIRKSVMEMALILTSSAHRELRSMQIDQAREIAHAAAAVIDEIQARPALYVAKGKQTGLMLGRELGAHIDSKARDESATGIGKLVGTLFGRVLFEIVFAILLAIVTGGAGAAARVGKAAADGAGTWAALAKKLGEALDGLPAIRQLIVKAVEQQSALKGGRALVPPELFGIIRDVIAKTPMNAQERVSAFRKAFKAFMDTHDGFVIKEAPSRGVEAFWIGDARPFGLVVDQTGKTWKHGAWHTAGTWDPGMVFVPDLSKWELVQ